MSVKRRIIVGIGIFLGIILIVGILIYPYLPINLDFRTYNNGYKLEKAFPNLSFDSPVGVYFPDDGSNRLFVIEQSGKIKAFFNTPEVTSTTVFLDLSEQITSGGETGLLGLAFHPDFVDNGLFYVDYTIADPLRTRVSVFNVSTTNDNLADPSSEKVIFEVSQPYSNHNAGSIVFGPDRYLYITLGDGGLGGDPLGNGQNTMTYLGSILRIDIDQMRGDKNYAIPDDNPFVNQTGYLPEIYAYGLRNPWKISWDFNTGTLWAGDVGQSSYEEIDKIVAGGNYGWNIMEASHCYQSDNCDQTDLILPVTEYGRDLGKAVTGGFVYYGVNEPELEGKYIYGDYLTGRIWYLDGINPSTEEPVDILKQNIYISSFGIDQGGEVLVIDLGGSIYDIVIDD